MTRERRIVQAFVELSDTTVENFDVVDFSHRVAAHCVELLDCAQAGVLLTDVAGALRVVASSSERSDALALLQSQNEEGPCFDSFQSGHSVSSEDLEADAGRWPGFAPLAVQMSFLSVQAFPMRLRGHTLGALSLFRARADRIAEADLLLGQGLADIAAIAVLQERTLRESRGVVAQLQDALSRRVVIEQARGILAERAQIGVDVAFGRLRKHARDHNLRLNDVARALIDGRLDTRELSIPARGSVRL